MCLSNSLKGKLYISLAYILMGSSVVSTAFLNRYLPPFTIIFISLLLGALTTFAFNGKAILKSLRRLSLKRWQMLFVQGFVGIFLYRVFLVLGVGMSSAAEAGVITGATPALTALLTYFILREALSRRSLIGIALTIIGILLLQGVPFNLSAFNTRHFCGNMLVLVSALCEAVFAVYARKLHHSEETYRPGPETQAGLAICIAFVFSIVPVLFEPARQAIGNMPALGWGVMCWYGILATFGSFAFLFKGAEFCSGYTLAAYTGLIPLSALVFAIVLLGDTLTLPQLAGGLIVIGAIFIMGLKPKNNRQQSTWQ